MILLQRILYFSNDPEGGFNIFQGGGGSNANFIETHITCDFPGGPDPLSPSGSAHDPLWQNFLDPHMLWI